MAMAARTSSPKAGRERRRRRTVALGVVAALACSVLAACGGDSGKPTLTWYINPDPPPPDGFKGGFGQAGIAERCSTDQYDIETQILPQSATEQRIQLLRRLEAQDTQIDLMSLDPVFTGEFANADDLLPIDQGMSDGVLEGAVKGATWGDQLVVAPLWANTQVLWYRKSMAEAAGLDMSQPVTWDQIIDAAADQGGKVGVQANKYEGYVVWINALIAGAGGAIMSDPEAGADAEVTINSEAGQKAAAVVQHLADSSAAEADLSVSNEGTVSPPFADPGGFMVNWTFIYNAVKPDAATFKDLGWARYPATVEGEDSRPPIGGINIGVSKYTDEPEFAKEAVACITSEDNQIQYAIETGNMPAREAAYDDPELRKQFPEDLLQLWLSSIDTAGPRPPSPYWGTIVNAVLSKWHPPSSVDPDSTPQESADFISKILDGDALL
jgi:multiple sugar transport system substrate-binding protein